MASLIRDITQAWRVVRAHRGTSSLAVLLLALAIGANGTIFSLINAVLLQPLPVQEPDRLVWFREPTFSYRQFEELRKRTTAFESLVAWSPQTLSVVWGGRADISSAFVVSGDFFSALGVRAALGRTLISADDAPGGGADSAVAVLSDEAYRRRFGADPAVIGRRLDVERVPFTIVGVAPRGFQGVAVGLSPEIYITASSFVGTRPESGRAQLASASYTWLHLMARLRQGMTADHAVSELQVTWPQLLTELVPPGAAPAAQKRFLARTIGLAPGRSGYSPLRREFTSPLLLLMGLVGLVLMAACANIGNVLLARASTRRPELATRLALGAGRRSLFTQLMAEAAICVGVASVLGVFFAWAGAGALLRLASTTAGPVGLSLAPDWRLSLFTSGVAMLSALACGLAAALQVTRLDPAIALRDAGRSGLSSAHQNWTRRALVVGQVATAVVLLIGAGLLVRSLMNLLSTDLGFVPDNLMLVQTDLRGAATEARNGQQQYEAAISTISSLPGVATASLSLVPPISLREGYWTREVKVDGQPRSLGEGTPVFFNVVGPDFFKTRGVRIWQGRELTAADGPGAARVVVVNQALVRRFFAGRDALGSYLSIGGRAERQDLQIVGVAENSAYQTIEEPSHATAYLSYLQDPETANTSAFTIEVRTTSNPESLAATIEQALRARQPTVPVLVESMSARIRTTLWKERLLAGTAAGLGLVALFVAAAGVMSVIARSVADRWREIGIRMALGASPARIVRTVVGEAIVLIAIGTTVGAGGALLGGRYAASLLYGVTPTDVGTAVAACALMLVVGVLAGYVPARRVLSLDPAKSMRDV